MNQYPIGPNERAAQKAETLDPFLVMLIRWQRLNPNASLEARSRVAREAAKLEGVVAGARTKEEAFPTE